MTIFNNKIDFMFIKFPILKNLLIIPITAQMLHFNIDSQLWKFSVEHNKNSVLKFLKN